MKLLVVEDNRTNLLVLKGILQKMDGCEVEAFADPLAALERAKAELFDLILVDYMMPGLDGRSFIEIDPSAARRLPPYPDGDDHG